MTASLYNSTAELSSVSTLNDIGRTQLPTRTTSAKRPVDLIEDGIRIRHGALQTQTISLDEVVLDFVCDFQTRHQVVLHRGGRVKVIRRNPARRRFYFGSTEPEFLVEESKTHPDLKRLLYVARYGFYAGITSASVHLLDSEFKSTFDTESARPLQGVVYNECSGEIVTFGPGYVLTWLFRKGGKTISPRAPITEGFSPSDLVSGVHLEEVPGKAQRCFSVVGTGVRIHYLMSGEMIAKLQDMHSTPITCVHYFRPLWYLLTAARDGTVRVWNSSWRLVSTFVGHLAAVTSLSTYPTGPYVMSSSEDCTIRVWNLETMDETERLVHRGSVSGVHSAPQEMTFVSRSTQQIFFWTVQHIHSLFTILWSTITQLTITTDPRLPPRLLVTCDDSTVRMVSPVHGQVITTALLPVGVAVDHALTLPSAGRLILACSDGVLRVMDSATNPCATVATWSRKDLGGCTCFGVYESVMDEESIQKAVSDDKWLAVTMEANSLVPAYRQKRPEEFFHSTVLVLVGTEDGRFGVLDLTRGTLAHAVQAHSTGAVRSITCMEEDNYVITTGSGDCEVSVWYISPHASGDALSQVMRIKADSEPSLVCRSRQRVCIAVNDHVAATYSLTMYSLKERTCFSQCCEMAHTNTITSLSCSDKLKCFLSASDDCTIRIWDEENHPIRIIHLTTPPEGVVFSSNRGDITLGSSGHLYQIPFPNYLPDQLLKEILALTFPKTCVEEEIPLSVELGALPPADQERLLKTKKELSQFSYRGGLSEEEKLMMKQAASEKAKCIAHLTAQSEELRLLRDGLLHPNRKRAGKVGGKERKEMWRELMSLILPFRRLELQFPEEEAAVNEVFVEPYKKGPVHQFFPPLSKLDPPYPIAPDGILPNSVILQQLRKSEADRVLASDWEPSTLTAEEIAAMASRKKPDTAEEVEEEDPDNEFFRKMKALMDQGFDESVEPTPTPSPTPPPTPPPAPVRTQMVVEKRIARPPPKSPTPPPKSPTPPPPKTPTPPPTPNPPPRPLTPLPEYIAQFTGREWFEFFFPSATSKTFPKPWSVSKFVTTLLSCIPRTTDYTFKASIAEAVLLLHHQRDILWMDSTSYSQYLLQYLRGPPLPTSSDPDAKQFILSSLKYLFAAKLCSPQLVALLMALAADCDTEIGNVIHQYLKGLGVNDDYGYFAELLGSWPLPSNGDVYLSCSEWIGEWASRMEATKQSKKTQCSPSVIGRRQAARSKKDAAEERARALEAAFNSCNAIDVIAFYLKMEHKQRLAAQRTRSPVYEEEEAVDDPRPKNTVLRLPKLTRFGGLIRLGETHCSRCHPERETSLALVSEKSQRGKYISEHLKLSQFSVNVPMKTQLLDPFGPEDSGEEDETRGNQVEVVCRQLQALVMSHKAASSQQDMATSSSWSGAECSKTQQPPLSLTNSSKYFVIDHTYVERSI